MEEIGPVGIIVFGLIKSIMTLGCEIDRCIQNHPSIMYTVGTSHFKGGSYNVPFVLPYRRVKPKTSFFDFEFNY